MSEKNTQTQKVRPCSWISVWLHQPAMKAQSLLREAQASDHVPLAFLMPFMLHCQIALNSCLAFSMMISLICSTSEHQRPAEQQVSARSGTS